MTPLARMLDPVFVAGVRAGTTTPAQLDAILPADRSANIFLIGPAERSGVANFPGAS
jgi:hypothetical protein